TVRSRPSVGMTQTYVKSRHHEKCSEPNYIPSGVLLDNILSLALALNSVGLGRGDRVVVSAPSTSTGMCLCGVGVNLTCTVKWYIYTVDTLLTLLLTPCVIMMLAVPCCGATLIPCPREIHERYVRALGVAKPTALLHLGEPLEISSVFSSSSDVKVVLNEPSPAPKLRQLLKKGDMLLKSGAQPGQPLNLMTAAPTKKKGELDDAAVMFLEPGAVRWQTIPAFSHTALVSAALAWSALLRDRGCGTGDTIAVGYPIHVVEGFLACMAGILRGSPVVLLPRPGLLNGIKVAALVAPPSFAEQLPGMLRRRAKGTLLGMGLKLYDYSMRRQTKRNDKRERRGEEPQRSEGLLKLITPSGVRHALGDASALLVPRPVPWAAVQQAQYGARISRAVELGGPAAAGSLGLVRQGPNRQWEAAPGALLVFTAPGGKDKGRTLREGGNPPADTPVETFSETQGGSMFRSRVLYGGDAIASNLVSDAPEARLVPAALVPITHPTDTVAETGEGEGAEPSERRGRGGRGKKKGMAVDVGDEVTIPTTETTTGVTDLHRHVALSGLQSENPSSETRSQRPTGQGETDVQYLAALAALCPEAAGARLVPVPGESFKALVVVPRLAGARLRCPGLTDEELVRDPVYLTCLAFGLGKVYELYDVPMCQRPSLVVVDYSTEPDTLQTADPLLVAAKVKPALEILSTARHRVNRSTKEGVTAAVDTVQHPFISVQEIDGLLMMLTVSA
ncbi:hypothetical protein KIPB_006477, partial [Kipferlia bialata]